MMDDKMKAAFLAWHDSVTYIGPEDIVEWTLDYLRSQQEPVAIYEGREGEYGYETVTLQDDVAVGAEFYANPVPSAPTIRAIFETVDPRPYGAIGTMDAPIKRVTQEDDGAFTVVIDHWPSVPAVPGPEHKAYAGCTIWRGRLYVSVAETEAIERHIDADGAFCDLVQRALDSLAAATLPTEKKES